MDEKYWSEFVTDAVMKERLRCEGICAAEREWGGTLRDAQERIENGQSPRKIPGWNAPYEDDEQ